MSNLIKNQQNILEKLGIEKLNPMQEKTAAAILAHDEVILLSPTGTGKTLAFLLPIISQLDASISEIQAMILVPSRELAIQIETVIREMGTGFKANAVYGGRSGSKDRIDIKHRPAILIGPPGRMADHLRRENFSTEEIKCIVLDEFDKSLEIGFEAEMREIMFALSALEKKILTSASQRVEIPEFVRLNNAKKLNYLEEGIPQLKIKCIISKDKDKLEALVKTLCHLGNQPGIIFYNFKDSIQFVSEHLSSNKIDHVCFHGGMEQKDREHALIKFRNGTHQLLIATDLAARGIDVPEIKFIIHYQLPIKSHEFTHRNGRTARMNSDGTAYVLKWEKENLPEFIQDPEIEELNLAIVPAPSSWTTLSISGGRKDKISKGDIAGLFIKTGKLKSEELGMIELKQDTSFVAVKKAKVNQLLPLVNNQKLKKKKIRVSML